MKPQLTVTIIELMALTMMVAICSNVWRTGQDMGWIATIVCVSLTTYWINHFRFPTGLPSLLFELPLIFFVLLCVALLLGLHHPPFMVPPGWQWPPFGSLQERIGHAFALSLWAIVWGIPTLLLCNIVRVVLAFFGLLPSNEAGDEQSDGHQAADHPL
jgi:hypothetical protein